MKSRCAGRHNEANDKIAMLVVCVSPSHRVACHCWLNVNIRADGKTWAHAVLKRVIVTICEI